MCEDKGDINDKVQQQCNESWNAQCVVGFFVGIRLDARLLSVL